MAARDAQNYRDLVAALDAKRKSTKLSHYNGFSYDKYYYTLARRLLAPTPSFRNFFTKDETGNFKHFSDEEWKSFADEVLAPRNEKVLAPFLNDKTAPEESEKFHKDLDELRKQEQGQNAQEAPKPEPKAEKKEEIKTGEGKKEEEIEEKPEKKEEPKVEAEKPVEKAAPEPKPLHVEQAEQVAAKAFTETKAPEKKPEIKHEAPPAKPGFAISPQGKVVAVKEKPKTKPTFSKEEQEKLERLKKTPQVQARREAVRAAQPKFENVPVPVPPLPQRLKLVKNTPIPEPVKKASSFAQINIRRLIYKIKPLPLISGAILGVVGFAAGGAPGAIAGAGIGVAGSNYLQNRAKEQELQAEAEISQPMEYETPIEQTNIESGPRSESEIVGPTPYYSEPEAGGYVGPEGYSEPQVNSQSGGGAGGGSGFNINPLRSLTNSYRPNAGNAAKAVGKQIGKQALKQGARQAGAELAAVAAANPEVTVPVLIGIGVVIVVLFLLLVVFKPNGGGLLESTAYCPPYAPYNGRCGAGAGGGPNGNPGQNSTVTVSKSGPAAVQNGENITYTITVTNNDTQSTDVDVTDQIPNNTEFVSDTGNPTNANGVLDWHITGLAPSASQSFTLVVKPLLPDIYVTNTAFLGSVTGASSTNSGSNTNTGTNTNSGSSSTGNNAGCNGQQLNNPLGNFGDPNCNFKESDLFAQLQQLDPANADYWFNVVIPCESSYNPNNYNPNAEDPAGAWGLTQMGRGKNGPLDHGDVIWPNQASNAVNYQHQSNSWLYWSCAASRW